MHFITLERPYIALKSISSLFSLHLSFHFLKSKIIKAWIILWSFIELVFIRLSLTCIHHLERRVFWVWYSCVIIYRLSLRWVGSKVTNNSIKVRLTSNSQQSVFRCRRGAKSNCRAWVIPKKSLQIVRRVGQARILDLVVKSLNCHT